MYLTYAVLFNNHMYFYMEDSHFNFCWSSLPLHVSEDYVTNVLFC